MTDEPNDRPSQLAELQKRMQKALEPSAALMEEWQKTLQSSAALVEQWRKTLQTSLTTLVRAGWGELNLGEGLLGDFWLATDAYIYGYPLVTMEMTRRVFTNVARPAGTHAPMGQLIKMRSKAKWTWGSLGTAHAKSKIR